jgi:predicted metal-dependent phosphoesterase TrpH
VIAHDLLIQEIDDIDIIETFNARTVYPHDNQLAQRFAIDYGKPTLSGSDAHTLWEYGRTYCEGLDVKNSQTFLASLNDRVDHCKPAPLWVHGVTKYVKWQKRNPSQSAK